MGKCIWACLDRLSRGLLDSPESWSEQFIALVQLINTHPLWLDKDLYKHTCLRSAVR